METHTYRNLDIIHNSHTPIPARIPSLAVNEGTISCNNDPNTSQIKYGSRNIKQNPKANSRELIWKVDIIVFKVSNNFMGINIFVRALLIISSPFLMETLTRVQHFLIVYPIVQGITTKSKEKPQN